MQKTTLKDKEFRTIGFIETKDNGDKVLKDRNFVILGFYDAEFNCTKDRNFKAIGFGDILTTLLKE